MSGAGDVMRVYGSKRSYYTGKLEAYFRYKELPYEFVPMIRAVRKRVAKETGAEQMPAVELPDGRWMTDSSPIIDWFESQHPEPAVVPEDPLQAFFSRLVEDYADEWLWRPAMHYRWSYRSNAMHLSRVLVDEVVADLPAPRFVMRAFVRRRQGGNYVRDDGVDANTREHVEATYFDNLARLEAIFAKRPFLLGERPTLADYGFMASMFRHFAEDPVPGDLMRERAPGVFEWQARVWNARASTTDGPLEAGVPDDWGPLLDEIGKVYLPFLCTNADAWAAGQARFDADIEGVRYRNLPISHYRVWCLEELRRPLRRLARAGPRRWRANAWRPTAAGSPCSAPRRSSRATTRRGGFRSQAIASSRSDASTNAGPGWPALER